MLLCLLVLGPPGDWLSLNKELTACAHSGKKTHSQENFLEQGHAVRTEAELGR